MRAPTNTDKDEYTRWKRFELVAEKDSPNALNSTQYWMRLCKQYPNISRFALDMLSIPASSCECERMFSELDDLLKPCQRNITLQLLAAIQCVRGWRKAGFSNNQAADKSTITDRKGRAFIRHQYMGHQTEHYVKLQYRHIHQPSERQASKQLLHF
jgi:hypothetical protein